MEWYSNPISSAISEVKLRNSFLIVFVTNENTESVNVENGLNDPGTAGLLKNAVCLRLIANSPEAAQFSAIYPVMYVPSIYLIDSQGIPQETILGESTSQEIHSKLSICINSLKVSAEGHVSSTEPGPSTGNTVNLEERVMYAKQRLEEKRLAKLKEEEEEAKRKEADRREVGKTMIQLKREREEQERRDAVEERRREQIAEKEHREQVKRQLQEASKDRAYREQMRTGGEPSAPAQVAPVKPITSQLTSTSCRIQLRFPDGSTHVNDFHATEDTLSNVRVYIQNEATLVSDPNFSWVARGQFSLSQAFPRRVFQGDEEELSLQALDLAPSSALYLIPLAGTHYDAAGENRLSRISIFSGIKYVIGVILIAPIQYLWSFIGGSSQPPRQAPSDAPQQTGRSEDATSAASKSVRYRNNAARLHDLPPSDDDNATWNGNSTQQM